ncbi:MAG: leucine-rich repeat domain-containing protein [Mycoplasmoidaceae bacterium]|nr:leucine-rich repeat domain-containing protein [Mycoplasmoidaceae bacterium]
MILPDDVTEICSYAFTGSTIRTISAKNVQKIGFAAFDSSDYLESLDTTNFPNIVEIGDSAFYQCKNIEKIDFSHSKTLITIDQSAFKDCDGLLELGLPNTLKTLGEVAFGSLNNLSTII